MKKSIKIVSVFLTLVALILVVKAFLPTTTLDEKPTTNPEDYIYTYDEVLELAKANEIGTLETMPYLEVSLNSDKESYTVEGLKNAQLKMPGSTLIIPEKWETETGCFPVTKIASQAFYEQTSFVNVWFGSNLETVEEQAFADSILTNLYNFKNTKVETIEDFAFANLSQASGIETPTTLTSIGEGNFAGWTNNAANIELDLSNFSSLASSNFNNTHVNILTLPASFDGKLAFLEGSQNSFKEIYTINDDLVLTSSQETLVGNTKVVISTNEQASKIKMANQRAGLDFVVVENEAVMMAYDKTQDGFVMKLTPGYYNWFGYTDISYTTEQVTVNGITARIAEIPAEGFANCDSLGNIRLDYIDKIGDRAFANSSISSFVYDPEGVNAYEGAIVEANREFKYNSKFTSLGEDVFANCYRMTSLQINGSNITRLDLNDKYPVLSHVNFDYNPQLVDLDISGLNWTYIKDSQFSAAPYNAGYDDNYGLFSLRKIVLPSTIRTFGRKAFNSSLVETIDFNGSERNITSFSFGLFQGTTNLDLDLSLFPNLTTINPYAFLQSGITKFNLAELPNLRVIGDHAFYKTQIEVVNITDNSNFTKIEDYAFANNANLKTVNIANMPNLAIIGKRAFEANPVLETVNFSNLPALTTIEQAAFKNDYMLNSINIEALPNLTYLGAGAFYGDTALTNLDFSQASKLTTLGVKVVYQADSPSDVMVEGQNYSPFTKSGLTTLDLSKTAIRSLYSAALADLPNLETLILPSSLEHLSDNGSGVQANQRAIYNNPKLQTLIITSNGSLGANTNFALENLIDSKTTPIQTLTLEYVNLPTTLVSWQKSSSFLPTLRRLNIVGDAKFAIAGISATGLVDVAASDNDKYILDLSGYALNNFNAAGNLSFSKSNFNKAILPASITSIPTSLFENMTYLNNVTVAGATSNLAVNIPTSVKQIGDKAFKNTAITELDLTANTSLFRIGVSAFEEVELTTLKLPLTYLTIATRAFYNTNYNNAEDKMVYEIPAFVDIDIDTNAFNPEKTTLLVESKAIRDQIINTATNNIHADQKPIIKYYINLRMLVGQEEIGATGGQYDFIGVVPTTYLSGDTITLPNASLISAPAGANFLGWYRDLEYTNHLHLEFYLDPNTANDEVTIYALYAQIELINADDFTYTYNPQANTEVVVDYEDLNNNNVTYDVSYAWQLDGTPIINQTNTLVLVDSLDAGTYTLNLTVRYNDHEVVITKNFVASFNKAENTLVITPSEINNLIYGDNYKISASATYGEVEVEYFALDESGSRASSLGTTRPVAAGNYEVEFSVAETDNYLGATKSLVYTIHKAPLNISLIRPAIAQYGLMSKLEQTISFDNISGNLPGFSAEDLVVEGAKYGDDIETLLRSLGNVTFTIQTEQDSMKLIPAGTHNVTYSKTEYELANYEVDFNIPTITVLPFTINPDWFNFADVVVKSVEELKSLGHEVSFNGANLLPEGYDENGALKRYLISDLVDITYDPTLENIDGFTTGANTRTATISLKTSQSANFSMETFVIAATVTLTEKEIVNSSYPNEVDGQISLTYGYTIDEAAFMKNFTNYPNDLQIAEVYARSLANPEQNNRFASIEEFYQHFAPAEHNVGTYNLTVYFVSTDSVEYTPLNYTITINKFVLTGEIDQQTVKYDGVDTFNPECYRITSVPATPKAKAAYDAILSTISITPTAGIYNSGQIKFVIPIEIMANYTNFEFTELMAVSAKYDYSKKVITITAEPQEITYGDDILQGEAYYSVTGLVEGENFADLGISVTLEASRTEVGTSGTITIRLSTDEVDHYIIETAVGRLTVKQREVKVIGRLENNAFSVMYGETIPLTYYFSGFVAGENSSVITGAPTVSLDGVKVNGYYEVGTYNILVDVSGVTAQNYYFTADNNTVITITKRKVDLSQAIVLANNIVTYDGLEHTLIASLAEGVNPVDELALSFTHSVTNQSLTSFVNAGTYEFKARIVVRPEYQANYYGFTDETGSKTATLTINKAEITFEQTSVPTYVYGFDFSNSNVLDYLNVLGLVNGESITEVLLAANVGALYVGTHPITINKEQLVAMYPNYDFGANEIAIEVEITKATLTITAFDQEVIYGNAIQNTANYYLITGYKYADEDELTVSVTLSLENNSIVPLVTNAAELSNYEFVYVNGSVVTIKAPLYVTIANQFIRYGSDFNTVIDFANNVSVTGLVGSDVAETLFAGFSLQVANNDTFIPVGNYEITFAQEFVSENYELVLTTGTLTVAKKEVQIIINDQTLTYGEDFSSEILNKYQVEGLIGSDTLVLDDNFSLVLVDPVYNPNTNKLQAGKYRINLAGQLNTFTNYNLVVIQGLLTVNKKEALITIYDQKITYGETYNPVLADNYTISGLLTGDIASEILNGITLVINHQGTYLEVGLYLFALSNTELTNYRLVVEGGSLTVNKKTLDLVIKDQEITYGETYNSVLEGNYEVTGFVNGDEASEVLKGVGLVVKPNLPVLAAGTYQIDLTSRDLRNYSLNVTLGSLTVNKKKITLADLGDLEFTYEFDYDGQVKKVIISGLLEGITYESTGQVAVGEYEEVITFKDTTGNYDLSELEEFTHQLIIHEKLNWLWLIVASSALVVLFIGNFFVKKEEKETEETNQNKQ